MIVITHHAVERFIERHAPEMGFDEAKALLAEKAPTAARLKQRTCNGQQQWQIEDPQCVLVMKRDTGKLYACVTVLPEPEESMFSEEEMDIIRERLEEEPEIAEDFFKWEGAKPPLIRPSSSPEQERRRIGMENVIWSKALDYLHAKLKESRRSEQLTLLQKSHQKLNTEHHDLSQQQRQLSEQFRQERQLNHRRAAALKAILALASGTEFEEQFKQITAKLLD